MAYDSNRGTARLAQALQRRMEGTVDMPMQLDFGIINDDMSLQTNTFEKPIPVTDYSFSEFFSGHEVETHPGIWNAPYPKPGDRVLVAWVGAEAVVLFRVISAENVEW